MADPLNSPDDPSTTQVDDNVAQSDRPANVNSANLSASSVKPCYDVCVIGGGIHGVGVAQAAAAAGYSVALLEKSRLAEGTSSRSSKLIHGGLRYLESFDISLVWESLRERELLFRIAPDLVQRQKFFIPVYDATTRKPWVLRLGLLVYALLAGGRRNTWFKSVPQSKWHLLDGLSQSGLRHVFQYWDGQTDDAALTRAVMDSAQKLGADLFYPARFGSAVISTEGVDVKLQFGSGQHTLHAKVIVNASGPWANEVLGQISPPINPLAVESVQGTHVEFPGVIDMGCYYVEAADKRVVFVMPWGDRTLVGTTESVYKGSPDQTSPLESEVQYLKDTYLSCFPDRDPSILNSWSGLRVLPAANGEFFRRSRETMLPVDNRSRPRLVSIYGGKLTGYRATAEKVMRILSKTLPKATAVARTSELTLHDPYSRRG